MSSNESGSGSPNAKLSAPIYCCGWGLTSIGAEYAYAAGYSGAGINIGMVDSGFFTATSGSSLPMWPPSALGVSFCLATGSGVEDGLAGRSVVVGESAGAQLADVISPKAGRVDSEFPRQGGRRRGAR